MIAGNEMKILELIDCSFNCSLNSWLEIQFHIQLNPGLLNFATYPLLLWYYILDIPSANEYTTPNSISFLD